MVESGIVSYGTGSVEVVPDTIVVRLGAEAEAEAPTGALEAAGAGAAAIVAVMRAAGVEAADTRTESADVHQGYDHGGPSGEPRPPRYVASTNLTVRLRLDVELEPLLDRAARAAGDAFRLLGLRYVLGDPGPARAQATTAAVGAALAQAQVLASAARVELGAVRRVEELPGGGGASSPRPMALAAERATAGPPIEPGVEVVSVSVLVEHLLG